jgi:hypothetical protein
MLDKNEILYNFTVVNGSDSNQEVILLGGMEQCIRNHPDIKIIYADNNVQNPYDALIESLTSPFRWLIKSSALYSYKTGIPERDMFFDPGQVDPDIQIWSLGENKLVRKIDFDIPDPYVQCQCTKRNFVLTHDNYIKMNIAAGYTLKLGIRGVLNGKTFLFP